jgi:hypothetical protein
MISINHSDGIGIVVVMRDLINNNIVHFLLRAPFFPSKEFGKVTFRPHAI